MSLQSHEKLENHLTDYNIDAVRRVILSYWLGKTLFFSPGTELTVQPVFAKYCEDIKNLEKEFITLAKPLSRITFYKKIEDVLHKGQYEKGPWSLEFSDPATRASQPTVVRKLRGKTYVNLCWDPKRLVSDFEPEMFDSHYWIMVQKQIDQFACQSFIETLEKKI